MEIKLNAKLSAYTNVNLKELAPQNLLFTATIPTHWLGLQAPFTQVVPLEGLRATDDAQGIVDIVLSSDWELAMKEDEEWSNIKIITLEDNKFKVYSDTMIDIPLNIKIKVVR